MFVFGETLFKRLIKGNIAKVLILSVIVFKGLSCENYALSASNGAMMRYAKIGENSRSSIEKYGKFYIGADVHWMMQRFDKGNIMIGTENIKIAKNALNSKGLSSLLSNFLARAGYRINKYVALELGYIRFGNLKDLNMVKSVFNGGLADIVFFGQIASFKYTTIESYFSVGYFFLKANNHKDFAHGFKTGLGVQAKVYGPIALRVGIDYYYPGDKLFSKKGFLSFKTGLELYFNV